MIANKWQFSDRQLQDFVRTVITAINNAVPTSDINLLTAGTEGNLVDLNANLKLRDSGFKALNVHIAGSETQGGDITGTVGNATVDKVGGKSKTDIASAVDLKHTQNTDTSLGAQSEDLDMNTHKIVGVVDPTADQHATTKKWVEEYVAGLILLTYIVSNAGESVISNAGESVVAN